STLGRMAGGGSYLQGTVDDICLYDRALSGTELAAIFATPSKAGQADNWRVSTLQNAALLWQLTGDPKYTNCNPMRMLSFAAQHYVEVGDDRRDVVGGIP